MKKAIALVMALVMCLSVGMMAFAEAESYDQDDAVVASGTTVLDTAGSADTKVDILVNSTNISVTVPLRYAVVADVKGGACLVPEDGTYYIQNNSAIAVDVTAADVVSGATNDKWDLVETAVSGIPDGNNQIDMTLSPAAGTEWNLAKDYPADWSLEAATSAGVSKLLIDIDANSSMLNTTGDQVDAYVITYTFAAA